MLAGCVSTTVQQVRQAESGIRSNQSIAILGRTDKTQFESEAQFIECVSDKTMTGEDGLEVIREQTFIDTLFPWFEPRTAPVDLQELERLIERPEIAHRIQQVGVRYLVWIGGKTERVDQAGTLQCAIAGGGLPACFGFLSWEGQADYEATIWDLSTGVHVGKLSSEATGTSFVPAIVFPLPFIARVQATACTQLSDRLKDFISG